MLRFLSVLFLVVAACSGSPVSPRILGGSDANITDYPYILSIERDGVGHYCGAVIVNADWALTDAWCTSEDPDVNEFIVRSGSDRLGYGKLHTVLEWIHHPLNDVFNSVFDFALVKVDPPFEFSENVAAASLVTQEQSTPDGHPAYIAGWGQVIYDSDQRHEQLQAGETAVLSEENCSEQLGEDYHNSKICVLDPKGQVAQCYRDEGGPLVLDGSLYGIAQYPGRCGETFEVLVFSRVASVRTWIDETIGA